MPSQPLSVDSKYRPDIDGLRAIAVSAVVVFHAFPSHLTGGFVGVDIFFVISGYLISSIIYSEFDAGSFSFLHFYAQRIRRIFPSLIVVLVASYLAGWYLLLAGEYKNLSIHIAAASGFSSNFLLCRESGYFDDASDTKPLLHLWSLGIEEQFYVIWPVLLSISWKTKLNLLTLTIGLTLFSFTLNIVKIKTDGVQTFYWPTTRAWELLIGGCVGFMFIYTNKYFKDFVSRLDGLLIALIYTEALEPDGTTVRNSMSVLGTLLIALPMYFLTKATVFPGWWAVAPTIGTALLISVGPTPWINRKILSARLLITLGLISYPLYLWHWPLLVYTRIFVGQQISYSARVAVIVLSILIAWATYICVEKPFRFGQFPKVKVVFLSVLMVSITFMGYLTYRYEGLPYRLPKLIRDITNYERYVPTYLHSYRHLTCFLTIEQDESKFGACVDNMENPASTAVTLWGDSHAAHLYPGIIAAKPNVRLTQLTAGGCPPISEIQLKDKPHCKNINEYVLRRISHEKPNTVVLAAYWSTYDWKNLTKTISNLRNAAIKNIYLVGPVPQWQNGLPRCLFDYFSRDALHRVPSRMHTCLVPNIDTLDDALQAFATENNIHFISAFRILCNSDGCLTRTGGSADTLTAYDYGHLTIAGSTFLVSHFPKTLLHLYGEHNVN